MRKLISFDTKVVSASDDEDAGLWSLRTSADETVVCQYLPEANAAISDFIRQRMIEQVEDPGTAEHLVPWDHPHGGKRPCQSDVYLQYLQSAARPSHCSGPDPHRADRPEGIATTAETILLDLIIYATGFDAISGPVLAIDISGMGGRSMKDTWADGNGDAG